MRLRRFGQRKRLPNDRAQRPFLQSGNDGDVRFGEHGRGRAEDHHAADIGVAGPFQMQLLVQGGQPDAMNIGKSLWVILLW